MLKRNFKLILISSAVVAGAVSAYLWSTQTLIPTPASAHDRMVKSQPLPSLSEHPTGTSKSESVTNEHVQFVEFQSRARQLFDQAARLDAQQKKTEIDAIAEGVSRYEGQGKLVPMEALLLKLAMLRYTTSDEQDYKDKAQALIERYKSVSEEKEQAWLRNPDPRFVDYKRREQDIVKEVMSMQIIPDGLSRDEYLRQQLERARIASMEESGGG